MTVRGMTFLSKERWGMVFQGIHQHFKWSHDWDFHQWRYPSWFPRGGVSEYNITSYVIPWYVFLQLKSWRYIGEGRELIREIVWAQMSRPKKTRVREYSYISCRLWTWVRYHSNNSVHTLMCRWRHVSVRVVADLGQSIFCVVLWLVLVWFVLCCVLCVLLGCCFVVVVCCCVVLSVVMVVLLWLWLWLWLCCVLLCVVGLDPSHPPPDPSAGPSSARPLSAGPLKISLFFPSPAPIFVLFLSLWGSSRGMLVVFLNSGTLKCARLGSPCETPAASGLAMRTPKCIFSGPRRFKHHQNSTKGPPREGGKNENCGGRREKKARNFGPPTFRGPTFRRPIFFWVSAPPCGPHHDTRTPRSKWIGQKWIGPNCIGQNWIDPKLTGPKPRLPKPRLPNLDWPNLVQSGWPKQDWPKSIPSLCQLNSWWHVSRVGVWHCREIELGRKTSSWFLTAHFLDPVKSYLEN